MSEPERDAKDRTRSEYLAALRNIHLPIMEIERKTGIQLRAPSLTSFSGLSTHPGDEPREMEWLLTALSASPLIIEVTLTCPSEKVKPEAVQFTRLFGQGATTCLWHLVNIDDVSEIEAKISAAIVWIQAQLKP